MVFFAVRIFRSADTIYEFSTSNLHNVMEVDILDRVRERLLYSAVCNLPSICAPDFYGARYEGINYYFLHTMQTIFLHN